MEGVGILAGDLVIVRHAKTARPDSVVAVTVAGESTLKMLQHREGKWYLIAANPRYPRIEIQSPAIVHGVVTAVMRSLKEGSTELVSWTQSARRLKE